MQPQNHRSISLAEAIADFDIENLSNTDRDDPLSEKFDLSSQVLVFDGHTIFEEDIDMTRDIAFGKPYPYNNHCIIIVNGSLAAKNIHMWRLDGLFVFGNLMCQKIHFREFYPVYVQGDLTVTKAVLASADQEAPYQQESLGKSYVRIQGTAFSPRIQTWFMPLHHLTWSGDSGKEFAEDKEYENNDKRLSDKIWSFE